MSMVAAASVATAKTAAKAAPTSSVVSGIVEHVELMENEGIVKLSEAKSLYIIKNLMEFPENKIQSIQKSAESGTTIRLKIDGTNQIVDVLL